MTAPRLDASFEEAVGRCFHPPGSSDGVATLTLTQVSDTRFVLGEGFRYESGATTIEIDPGDFTGGRTDLTSVPRALRWFVDRSGRHTAAALLHDALVARVRRGPGPRLAGYEDADARFLEALRCLGVPPVRRTTMWAAVALGTRLRAGGYARVGILAWLVGFVLGSSVLVGGLVAGEPAAVAAALLGPVPGAAAWGRQARAGLVAGYAALFVATPTLVGALSYAAYWVLERAVLLLAPRTSPTTRLPDTGL